MIKSAKEQYRINHFIKHDFLHREVLINQEDINNLFVANSIKF